MEMQILCMDLETELRRTVTTIPHNIRNTSPHNLNKIFKYMWKFHVHHESQKGYTCKRVASLALIMSHLNRSLAAKLAKCVLWMIIMITRLHYRHFSAISGRCIVVKSNHESGLRSLKNTFKIFISGFNSTEYKKVNVAYLKICLINFPVHTFWNKMLYGH